MQTEHIWSRLLQLHFPTLHASQQSTCSRIIPDNDEQHAWCSMPQCPESASPLQVAEASQSCPCPCTEPGMLGFGSQPAGLASVSGV